MITFNRIDPIKFKDDIYTLLSVHYSSAHMYNDKIPLNMDWETLSLLWEAGVYRVYGIFSDDKLIGYSAYVVQPHVHSFTHTFASNDGIFLHPDYRGSGIAEDVINYVEKELKDEGVSAILYVTTVKRPCENLMKRQGYEKQEIVYAKCVLED